ncbi:STAS domain-containing protein [Streptomyces sp. NPDC003393]
MRVCLSGELDFATAPAVGSALDFSFSLDHSRGVTVDAADLTFIDAAGLRPLVQAQALGRRRGQWLRIAPVGASLRQVLTLTRHTHRLLECTAADHGDDHRTLPVTSRPLW